MLSSPAVVKIATWNLARPPHAGIRTSRLLGHIRDANADVWVLTETRLALSPGSDYQLIAHSGPAPDREPDECWTAIWVRRGIDGEAARSGDPERTACARLRTPSGQPLYVYGAVLPWLTDTRRLPLTGAAAFAAALTEQAADWRRIRCADPSAVLCVAGDLNQDLLARGHHYGSAEGRRALRETLLEVGLTCLTAGEADPVVHLGNGRASIDHLCLAGLAAGESTNVSVWPPHELLGARLTDHHGVAVCVPSLSRGADDSRADRPTEVPRHADETEHLAVLGRMLTGVLIDLRNPLGVIKGAAAILDEIDAPQQVRRYSDLIRRAAAQIDEMLLDVLEYSRRRRAPEAEVESHPDPDSGLQGTPGCP
jgi:hypothetical protein